MHDLGVLTLIDQLNGAELHYQAVVCTEALLCLDKALDGPGDRTPTDHTLIAYPKEKPFTRKIYSIFEKMCIP